MCILDAVVLYIKNSLKDGVSLSECEESKNYYDYIIYLFLRGFDACVIVDHIKRGVLTLVGEIRHCSNDR